MFWPVFAERFSEGTEKKLGSLTIKMKKLTIFLNVIQGNSCGQWYIHWPFFLSKPLISLLFGIIGGVGVWEVVAGVTIRVN